MSYVKKPLSEKELMKFLNTFGVAKHLKFFATMLCDKKFNLKLTYGGGSYTDWKTVFIGLPKTLVGKTKEEVLSYAKGATAHEIEHINSTPFEPYQKFIKDFVEYFKTKHDISEAVGKKVGGHIINSLEDGRIERLSSEKFGGVLKHLIYLRSIWWKENQIKEESHELFDTLFCVTTFATMGLFPNGYAEKYQDKEELYDMIRGVKPEILQFVNADDFNDAVSHAWEVVYKIEDWMVEQMKSLPEEDLNDMLDNLSESASSDSEISEGYGSSSSTSSSSGEEEGDSTGESKGSGIHDAFGGGSKTPTEGSTFTSGDLEGDVFGDESMSSIVEKALKSAEEEIIEEEHKNIIQADFDDLMEAKKEKENAGDSSISDEEQKELRDYYRNLPSENRDGNWDAKLRIHKFKYPEVQAPQSIQLEAKKLKKDFEKIFLNKASLNSRNRKRGMLDTNALWKVQNKDYNIFQKKGNPENSDYVFYILVDGSGSMYGNKFKQAYKATSLLEESLGAFVPVKIVQFDADYGEVNHYVVKEFEERRGNLSWAFVNNNQADNCNMDGFSVRVALKELAKRKESKKVLIVLSDGQPSGAGVYYGGRAERDVKEAIREGRKQNVDIFNIMFGDEYSRKHMIESFKFMYEKGIISCEPENIGRELLRVVKRELSK
ncbi:VWA domain-containing protein [Clostridium disporicum]|uniref:VWA domain-containing protein n=1 Tax=Clostridium disporicum TaxID=84024 RepID=UPI0034A3951F